MARPLSQKSSFRLFTWGIILIPFAIVSDAFLDTMTFGNESIREQLFSPTYQEVPIRFLFSIFIMAAIYLGMHYLAKTAEKEASLGQRVLDLSLARQDLVKFHENVSRQLRQTSAALSNNLELLQIQCSSSFDEKTRFFVEGISNCSARLNEQLDIDPALKETACSEPHRERTRLDQLAEEVFYELQKKRPEREQKFKIQPWLTAWFDRKMLRLIIYNLFSNAIDFIPETYRGRIDFGMFNRNEQKFFLFATMVPATLKLRQRAFSMPS